MARTALILACAIGAIACSKKEDERLAEARVRLASFPSTVALEPLALEARVPESWKCRTLPDTHVRCSHPTGVMTHFLDVSVEPEPRNDPISELAQPREGTIAVTDIAGFHGRIDIARGKKRPQTFATFEGWRDDPSRGRLALRADASLFGDTDDATLLALVIGIRAREDQRSAPAGSSRTTPPSSAEARP